jgi:CubicO group peptidase (beta-lactamase class C family)
MNNAFVSTTYIHRSLARSVLFLISLLIVTAAVLVAAKVAAQQSPSAAGSQFQSNGGEEAAVKRVVESIIQPYLAQGQSRAGGRLWRRSPYLGAIVAVSLNGHRYFFPYGKATDAGAPFTGDTLVEIGSCTKTFTTACVRAHRLKAVCAARNACL